MWEPRRLTTPWALTACYRDSFTLPFYTTIWASWNSVVGVFLFKGIGKTEDEIEIYDFSYCNLFWR
jgi:hypothetical protein